MSEKEYLYVKIKDYILDNIQNKVYKDGKIESENQLAKKFQVSRMTVRQALLSLQQDGVIYVVPKKGAYIRDENSFKTLDGLQSFSEDVAGLQGKTHSYILLCQKEQCKTSSLCSLGLSNDFGEVWHVIRIRYLNREPIAYEDSYYNANLIDAIPDTALNGSLYAYFEEELHLDMDYSKQKIDACLADGFAKYLEVSKNTPLLRILQTTYLKDSSCIEYGYSCYRVDSYSFNQTAYRKRGRR
ncbi:GntR family transcriptional regulator [Thomasclavelia sp.]